METMAEVVSRCRGDVSHRVDAINVMDGHAVVVVSGELNNEHRPTP